ncbi:M48 family metallopeptidase [Haloprofundus salinisoli]|uniref:M48 family metallopeptidase n=1 Tax=Haloprofundus salinisoli TaxID=2876193 RepID=UPI001CCF32BC|nr:YgjP-like metallopeptidase domain-containing protein [Haloprofundus salinisoli]
MSAAQGAVKLQTGEQVSYTVHRRDIQNPRLTLNPDGTLAVILPDGTPSQSLLAQNTGWIESQYEEQLKHITEIKNQYGNLMEGITLWGNTYNLIETDGEYKIQIDGEALILQSPSGRAPKPYLYNQTRKALRHALRPLAQHFCEMYETKFSTLSIRNQQTKWASCSGGRNLNFNVRCAFLPVPHIRYLVVHEVAHLLHPKHTDSFWELVASTVPKYRKLRSELQGFWYTVHRNNVWKTLLGQS